jgi:hypothetical protein
MSPRQIQRATGLLAAQPSWLATLAYIALLPVLILTAAEPQPHCFGALYIEATKLGSPT